MLAEGRCAIAMKGRRRTSLTPQTELALLPTPSIPTLASSRSLTLTRLAEALRYLHNEAMPGFQLLHRDIKPDNMGFRADGSLVRHPLTPPLASCRDLTKCDPSPDPDS